MAKSLTLLLLIAAAVAGAFWWQQRRTERAEMDAGLAASRTLSAVFERTSALQVAHLSGEAVTRVDSTSGYGLFANVQTTRAPYSVDYLVDLSRLGPSDYRWNAKAHTMVVTIPAVRAAKPNIDLSRATTTQAGLVVSRASGLAMQQRAAANLALAAGAKAQAPEMVARAQESARSAVAALTAAPLAAAGLTNVRVVVRLPGEARPAGLDRERWNESTPISDLLNRL